MRPIKRFQTLVDFTVQNAGAMDSLFDVAEVNSIGITDDLQPGAELLVTVVDSKVASFYESSVNDITTDVRPDMPGGIGYMQIGSSFRVS